MADLGARRRLRRHALRRGVLGSSRLWLAIYVIEVTWRLLRRKSGVQLGTSVKPGETVEIRHLPQRRR